MNRYEQEIADLIEKLEEKEHQSPRLYRRDRPPQLPRRRSSLGTIVRKVVNAVRLSPMHFMVIGLALVILSMFIRQHAVSQWMAIIGVVLFLCPIVVNLISRGSYGREEKMWRGRPVEPDETSWNELRNRMEHAAHDFKRRFRRRY